ncbi:hypothetical protein [Streptomyces sp. NPDC047525]|uniref:hypothetical protein n=1 Tax=Streptomyces sp. NPDC047525 TaxID=3155264 RepID=UPI003410017D
MTPYERLMAEAVPTGRFGDPAPNSPAQRELATSVAQEQVARRAALADTQRDWLLPDERSVRDRERNHTRPRHLRLITNQDDTQAA